MLDPKEKIYEIKICGKPFLLAQEQILFFSIHPFLLSESKNQPLNIACPQNISEIFLISCFEKIFDLFSTTEQIKISQSNVFIFQFLSNIFNNSTLFSICQNVLLNQQKQTFFLYSEQFTLIPKDIMNSLNDYKVYLNNGVIECNQIYSSSILNEIFKEIQIIQCLL
jgi:hypothetical protein